MRIVISSPSVAPHVRQSVSAYNDAGCLGRFHTTFLDHPDYRLASLLKRAPVLSKEVQRRSFSTVSLANIRTRAFPELLRSASARKLGPVITDRVWEWAELGFDRWVARSLSAADDIVHTYEHAALSTLQRAAALKLFSIYEQSSVHHSFFSAILKEQLELYPDLINPELVLKSNALATRRNMRRDRELALADLVLCNSSFTQQTLVQGGVAPQKIAVLPLAFPPVSPPRPQPRQGKSVIFLHAGNQSVTKGSHILYQAWNQCAFSPAEAELWLIGRYALPDHFRKDLKGNVIVRNNIPHSELMSLYQQSDVLVMPTLSDGFGMVITEAMSKGVPVVASHNCCAPDLVTPGKNGWMVPAGDIDALAAQLKWCAANPQQLYEAGELAREKAAQWQWVDFRSALVALTRQKWHEWHR